MQRLSLALALILLATLALTAPAPAPGEAPSIATSVPGGCGDPVEQLLTAGPALCRDPSGPAPLGIPELLPAATIHCCSQTQIDLCRQQCKDLHCRSSIGCRAGECACTCNC
jgi:hypothetical protein